MHFIFLFVLLWYRRPRLLNIECTLDLYALHFVITQQHLDLFRQGWAHHHHMRTEQNRSPLQLWMLGLQTVSHDDEVIRGLNVRKSHKK